MQGCACYERFRDCEYCKRAVNSLAALPAAAVLLLPDVFELVHLRHFYYFSSIAINLFTTLYSAYVYIVFS